MSENHTPAVVMVEGQPATVAPDTGATEQAAQLGGLADVLKAGLARLEQDSSHVFDVPGWQGQMRLVARKIRDDERELGTTTVATIALATKSVELNGPDGWQEVPHGWAGVAGLMGDETMQQTEVIRRVLDNGTRLDAFAARIVGWMLGRQDEIEAALGE